MNHHEFLFIHNLDSDRRMIQIGEINNFKKHEKNPHNLPKTDQLNSLSLFFLREKDICLINQISET